MAVRALKLCQIAYFRRPHSPFDYATTAQLATTRTTCRGKSEVSIQNEIKYYLKGNHLHLPDLADAAVRVCKVEGAVDPMTRTRVETNVSANPVCYHGVVAWLFSAGMVSKRWFAKEGNSLTGYSANDNIGKGRILDSSDWDRIPKGYIWNIHRTNDKATCHWGVSLGHNKAIACNNTDESPDVKLVYDMGDTKYGKFNFTDICAVLNANRKYGYSSSSRDNNIVVRLIDPIGEAKLY